MEKSTKKRSRLWKRRNRLMYWTYIKPSKPLSASQDPNGINYDLPDYIKPASTYSHHFLLYRLQTQQPSFPIRVLRIIKNWLAWQVTEWSKQRLAICKIGNLHLDGRTKSKDLSYLTDMVKLLRNDVKNRCEATDMAKRREQGNEEGEWNRE